MVTVRPEPGTTPANETVPEAGARTISPARSGDIDATVLPGRVRIGPERVRTEHVSVERPRPGTGRWSHAEGSEQHQTERDSGARHPPVLYFDNTEKKTVPAEPSACQISLQRIAVERVARDTREPCDDGCSNCARRPGRNELDDRSDGGDGFGDARGRPITSVISPFGASPKRSESATAVSQTTSSKALVNSRQTATSRFGSSAARLARVAGSRFGDSNATVG